MTESKREKMQPEDEKLAQEIEELEELICTDIEKGIPVTEATNRRIAEAMMEARREGDFDL